MRNTINTLLAAILTAALVALWIFGIYASWQMTGPEQKPNCQPTEIHK